jgi:hypothetical protein
VQIVIQFSADAGRSVLNIVHASFENHSAFHPLGSGETFPGKKRPCSEANQSPLSTVDFENERSYTAQTDNFSSLREINTIKSGNHSWVEYKASMRIVRK